MLKDSIASSKVSKSKMPLHTPFIQQEVFNCTAVPRPCNTSKERKDANISYEQVIFLCLKKEYGLPRKS
jgi:hypothetical protein